MFNGQVHCISTHGASAMAEPEVVERQMRCQCVGRDEIYRKQWKKIDSSVGDLRYRLFRVKPEIGASDRKFGCYRACLLERV